MAETAGRAMRIPGLLLLIVLVATTGCTRGVAPAGDGRIRVVTTIGMITDVAERVGGGHVRVQGLMGPGVDPHLYKARAGDVRKLTEAQIIFYGGLHLEAAMGEVLEEMANRTTSVAVTDSIPRTLLLRPSNYAGSWDPHVWFDVELWMYTVKQVERTFASFDPAHADEYHANAALLLEELVAVLYADLRRIARRERLPNRLFYVLGVIRMQATHPAATQRLIRRHPRQRRESRIDILPFHVGVRRPENVRNRLSDGAEAFFAFTKRVFCAIPLHHRRNLITGSAQNRDRLPIKGRSFSRSEGERAQNALRRRDRMTRIGSDAEITQVSRARVIHLLHMLQHDRLAALRHGAADMVPRPER